MLRVFCRKLCFPSPLIDALRNLTCHVGQLKPLQVGFNYAIMVWCWSLFKFPESHSCWAILPLKFESPSHLTNLFLLQTWYFYDTFSLTASSRHFSHHFIDSIHRQSSDWLSVNRSQPYSYWLHWLALSVIALISQVDVPVMLVGFSTDFTARFACLVYGRSDFTVGFVWLLVLWESAYNLWSDFSFRDGLVGVYSSCMRGLFY